MMNPLSRCCYLMAAFLFAGALTALGVPPARATQNSVPSQTITLSAGPVSPSMKRHLTISAGAQAAMVAHGRPSVPAMVPASVAASPSVRNSADPGPKTPAIALSFAGMFENQFLDGFAHKPPDTHVAAGTGAGASGRVIEVTNGGVHIFDKTGASVAAPVALDDFIGSGTMGAGFDPKVIFDQHSGRFFIVVLEGSSTATSIVHIAVSNSSTPSNYTTDWIKRSATGVTDFTGSGGTGAWFDYPSIAADDDSVVVTGNMFSNGGALQGEKIRIYDKAMLIGGTHSAFDINIFDPSGLNFTPQPVHVYNTTDSGNFYCIARDFSTSFPNRYRLTEISGPPGAPAIVGASLSTARIWASGGASGTYFVPQLGTVITLDAVMFRLMNAVYRNGIITTCSGADAEPDSEAEVFWAKIATNGGLGVAAPTVADSGFVHGQGADDEAFMPSINVNAHGETLVNYSECGPGKIPEMRYASRAFADAPGTFGASVLLTGPLASEEFYDDFNADNPDRWGDYSGCAVDPDDDSFWIANELVEGDDFFASATSSWKTAIIKTQAPTSASVLNFDYQGGTVAWRTQGEADNLGFHIHREVGGQRVRATASPIAGAALNGDGTYAWRDEAFVPDAYWLESIDLQGNSSWHGPFRPARAPQPITVEGPSPTLADLGGGAPGELRPLTAGRGRGSWKKLGRTALTPPLTVPLLQAQARLAGRAAIKIGVDQEGWYSLSRDELVAAGLNPRVDPRTLQLYAETKEQAILVTGERDGRLDTGDTVQFYGVGLDTPHTDTRVYWLTAGPGRGKRIKGARGADAGPGPLSFPYTVEHRERTVYFSALVNGEADNFFGRIIASAPVPVALELPHAVGAGNAQVEVVLQGVTDIPQPGPDHRVGVALNGVDLGDVIFDGRSVGTFSASVPQGKLLPGGGNVLTLTAEGGPTDISLVDTVRVTYQRSYAADGDELRFTAPGGTVLTLAGFGADATVVDVSDPANAAAVETAPGPGGLQVSVPGRGGQPRLLFASQAGSDPAWIEGNAPSAWYLQGRGAAFAIIGHENVLGSFAPLQALRRQQGLATSLIDVQDLYDEFSFGAKDPWAIRNFLALSQARGRVGTRYVLLAGDASFDPRNYLGAGNLDLVPTKLLGTEYGETASDDWFVDFNDDALPELAIGRLSVRDGGEAAGVVAKLVAHSQAGPVSRRAIFVTDENAGYDFIAASSSVASLLPSGMAVQSFAWDPSNPNAARQQLLAGVQAGQTVVNYIGHGSTGVWMHGLLGVGDVSLWTSAKQLPLVTAMTCLNGFFQDPRETCLAEALVNTGSGGALAVWASSALTEPEGQILMSQELFRLLFGGAAPKLGSSMTLGEAAMRAKAATTDPDVRRSWVLFGDPTSTLR
jgi:hypothetical protein